MGVVIMLFLHYGCGYYVVSGFITTGSFPYQDIHNDDLLNVLTGGKRLPKPVNCSDEL